MCTANGCLGGAKPLATSVTHTFNSALATRPIVTDDAFVYWLNDDAGVVKAIAKSGTGRAAALRAVSG